MNFRWKEAALTAVISLTAFLTFSCASTRKAEEESYVTQSEVESTAVAIPIPSTANRGYFSSVPKEVIELIEYGSPQSLRQAVSLLHKNANETYTVQEKVLIKLCAQIMALAYPEETVSWEVPDAETNNPYLGAIESAKKKIYDSSTGNSDVLSTMLPSMVLFVTDDSASFYNKSLSALEAVLQVREKSVLANYLMGELYSSGKNWGDALKYYDRALESGEAVNEIINRQGRAYMMNGKGENALESCEKVLSKQPQNMSALEVCARTAYAMGDLEKAEGYVLRVLQVEPENLEFVLLRARILMDNKDYIRASSLLDAYSKTDVRSREYLLLRAKLLRDWNKNGSGAAEYIQQALVLYPDDVEILSFAASLASSSNIKIADMSAYELSQKVLELDENNREAVTISIQELCKDTRWNEAYEMSLKVIQSPSATVTEKCTHVEICLALGKNNEAAKLATQLYQNDQNNEETQQVYLKMLVATGMKNQAKALIATLMNNASLKMKSFLYYERSFYGTTEDAVLSDLRSSLTANPRNKDALFRLYQIYFDKRDWKKAQYYLKQVVALNPSDATMLKLNSQLDSFQGK